MEGLAKAAPSLNPAPIAQPKATQSIAPFMFNGIPFEFINHFNVDIKNMEPRDRDQLIDIYKILGKETPEIGDVMMRMSEVERKLGSPSFNETRYGKIWSYLKVSERVSDLQKQQKAMELV